MGRFGYGEIKPDSSDGYSFPSGDSMNAGSFAATLIASGAPVGPSMCVAVYAGLGRVYWWYHWIGDCVGGVALAFGASSFVDWATGGFGHITALHYGLGTLGFITFMKATGTKRK